VGPVALRPGLPAERALIGKVYFLASERFRRLTLCSATAMAAARPLPPGQAYPQ